MEDKLLTAQKYFLFKLTDILNNSYHTFEEKRAESLRLVLKVCLDTYREIHATAVGTDKLVKAYNALLSNLSFQLKRHPFMKLGIYRRDFERLCDLIQKVDKESQPSYEIFLAMESLLKKLNKEKIVEKYIECLKMELSFGEVDILISTLISDWLYMGYSQKYLYDWYTGIRKTENFYAEIQNGNTAVIIERLAELNGEQKEYEIIIPYRVNEETQQEDAKQLLAKNFDICNKSDKAVFSECEMWNEETYACIKVLAADCYKAMELAKNEFVTNKELFSMWKGERVIIKENFRYGCVCESGLIVEDVRSNDNTRLISYLDKNRVEQLNSFIELKGAKKNDDVDTLERILHTLHTAKTYNIQNRYLNFWSALEYALHPFPRNSIIEKARVIVPESFVLFYIKNKINIFWERLVHHMEKAGADKAHTECWKFMEECKDDKDYDTLKVIEYLQNETKYKELLADISFHVVLQRELMELIMLVTEPKRLKDTIDDYHDEILHDLDFVYRLRNQLIHSAKGKDDCLEHISLRLHRYVNSIIATILYYKKKNADVSIEEILNSLHNTYNAYMEKLESWQGGKKGQNPHEMSVEDGYSVVRPQYLFLE